MERVVGVREIAQQRAPAGVRRRQPLVRIERDRVRSLDALEQRPEARGRARPPRRTRRRRGTRVRSPAAIARDLRQRIDRPGRRRPCGRNHRDRPQARRGGRRRSKARRASARSRNDRRPGPAGPRPCRGPSMSAARHDRRVHLASTRRAPTAGPPARPRVRTSQPATRSRATFRQVKFAIAPPEVIIPPAPRRQAEARREPARQVELDLGCGGRVPPAAEVLVQAAPRADRRPRRAPSPRR